MRKTVEAHDADARRRVDNLLRDVMMALFSAGAFAIVVLWVFEAKYKLIDEVCRVAYPAMLAIFLGSTAMLYRWPHSTSIARWTGFSTITGYLFMELMASMSTGGPLAGNYAFISLLMWLPLAYAIALFMLDARHAPWAASGLFLLIASASVAHIVHSDSSDSGDTALLINLMTSHVVLLACLSGLVKIKLVLFKAEAQSRRLFEQASTDPLTGLANRRFGLDMLRLAASENTADTPSAVMLCDIDHFKEINDRFGHDVGDKVVLAIASVLQANTREIDTVVRWGGDEFLVVVPGIGKPALAELAERLRLRAADACLAHAAESPLEPTLSIGVAEMTAGERLDDWIKRADQALYHAKAGGRNRCVFARSADLRPLSSLAAEGHSGLDLVSEAD